MDKKPDVSIYEAIFGLKSLMDEIPLSKAEREKYQLYIQAVFKLTSEWEKLKDNGRPAED